MAQLVITDTVVKGRVEWKTRDHVLILFESRRIEQLQLPKTRIASYLLAECTLVDPI